MTRAAPATAAGVPPSYRELLRRPWVRPLLAGAVVGRLPVAMTAIGITLTLRAHHLGFGLAGAAAALFAAGQAAFGPVLGRRVDRHRQTPVLVAAAVVSAMALTLIAALPTSGLAVLVGAGLAGAATPPIEACLRALWPVLVGVGRVHQAYALDAAAQELIFIGGPLLVAVSVAVGPPELALLLTAGLALAGTLVVASAPPSRAWRGAPSAAGWLGPPHSGRLVVLLVGLAGSAIPVGGLSIVAVAYAEQHPVPGGGSVLLGINATGALAGALISGRLHWTAPPARRAVLLSAALATGYLLLAGTPPVPVTALICLVAGSFLPPLLVIAFALTDELAPEGTVVEAFSWLNTLFAVGVATGSALAGALRQLLGTPAAAAGVAAVGFLGTAVLVLFARRSGPAAAPRAIG